MQKHVGRPLLRSGPIDLAFTAGFRLREETANEHLFWLTDAQMARLEPEMPPKVPPGATYNSLWLWVQQFAPADVAWQSPRERIDRGVVREIRVQPLPRAGSKALSVQRGSKPCNPLQIASAQIRGNFDHHLLGAVAQWP